MYCFKLWLKSINFLYKCKIVLLTKCNVFIFFIWEIFCYNEECYIYDEYLKKEIFCDAFAYYHQMPDHCYPQSIHMNKLTMIGYSIVGEQY